MNKYPAYKDSGVEWIGEIPQGWEPRKLAFLGAFLKGSGISRAELTEAGVPVILYGDIYTQYDIKTKQLIKFTSEEVAQKAIEIQNGDLLLTGSGETKEDIGKCVVFLGNDKSYAGGDIIILRPDSQNSLFLSYVLNSEKARIEKAKISKGEIIVHIYSSKLRDIFVPLPPPEEQTAIAHYLDQKTAQIDTLLRQSEKIIALLQEQRTAIINQAVTKGLTHLPPAQGGTLGVPLKDSGVEWIGEVPVHWGVKRLKHISPSISVGLVINPSKYYDEDGTIPMLTGRNVVHFSFKLDTLNYINEKSSDGLTSSRLHEGDIVTVRVGYPGVSAVVPKSLDGANCASMMITRKSNMVDSNYLVYGFNSIIGTTQVDLVVYGAAQKQFNIGHATEFTFTVPPKDEQIAIVHYLDQKTTEIATLIQKEEQRMALLKEYRASLISEVVTGRVMVV